MSHSLKSAAFMAAAMLIVLPAGSAAQKDAREILADHSVSLRADDLSMTFIYLHPDIAEMVLTSEEFARYEQEKSLLRPNWSLMAVRIRSFRDARFDPTQLFVTQREVTHTIGFQDVVDVNMMFTSTLSRGEQAFGFLKIPDRIDFRQAVEFGYERYKVPFVLDLKYRQKYFQFMTGRNIPPQPPPRGN
jgi:hypothetical protein